MVFKLNLGGTHCLRCLDLQPGWLCIKAKRPLEQFFMKIKKMMAFKFFEIGARNILRNQERNF